MFSNNANNFTNFNIKDMKYKCKENDVIIELSKSKDELLIYVKGDEKNGKVVVGAKDIKQALIEMRIIDGVPF